MRMGIGYDIHRLVPGRALILGGVRIDYPLGLLGHSDGDVLTHAVIDALLGAAGLGDIGEHFPDTDPAYKNADSGTLLANVINMVESGGFVINNIDTIIVAEKPTLGPYKREIEQRLAEVLKIDVAGVNVKAKTAEQIGPEGRAEAMAAWAVVSLGGPSPSLV